MILTLGLLSVIIHAQTIIPAGNVSGVWNAAGSPYLIQGNITIPYGESLQVGPGVDVNFQGEYEWNVNGLLEAVGTVNDSIRITAQDTSLHWSSIIFQSPDCCRLEYCIVEYGYSAHYGGGVFCCGTEVVISHCTFRHNWGIFGGAIYLASSNSSITSCDIVDNGLPGYTDRGGGVFMVDCDGRPPIIANNYISGNYAISLGGGLYIAESDPIVIGNFITGNTNAGGILIEFQSNAAFLQNNIITDNMAGIFGDCVMLDKTVVYNNSSYAGGGIISYATGIRAANSIVWSNSPDQISGTNCVMIYNDIQDGWPGIGNIDDDPLFVDPEYDDFRLQWGSPCIDAGNPDSLCNDPDGTQADMGAFYYDQSIPIRVLLTPHERSIVIPTEGGGFDFTYRLTNINPAAPPIQTWIDITLPGSSIIGPVLGPVIVALDSGVTIDRLRAQVIPAGAPRGLYSYNAYAVVGADTSFDSFSFFKLGSDGSNYCSGWDNFGESLDRIDERSQEGLSPSSFYLLTCHPNPFNPTTAISYTLRVASRVNISIYNVTGSKVATLIDRGNAAGAYEVMFDGRDLPSGIYFARLTAGELIQTQKLVLMK